jgi:hypothetical protein
MIDGRTRRSGLRAAVAVTAVAMAAFGCSSGPGASSNSNTASASPATQAATLMPSAGRTAAPSVAAAFATPIAGAADSGTTINLIAVHTRWSLASITVPTGKTWTVHIDDQDLDRQPFDKHNFVVRTGATVASRVFVSPNFGIGSHTFSIPALPAGTYTFQCAIHTDSMTETLIVK